MSSQFLYRISEHGRALRLPDYTSRLLLTIIISHRQVAEGQESFDLHNRPKRR